MRLPFLLSLAACLLVEGKRRHHKRRPTVAAAADVPAAEPQGYNYGTPGNTYAQQAQPAMPQNVAPVQYGAAANNQQPQTQQQQATGVEPNQQAAGVRANDVSGQTVLKNHSVPLLSKYMSEIDQGKVKHHNYEQMTWFMKYFAEQYPEIARIYDIGTTVQNRKMWVMEISDNVGKHELGEPEMKYIGNMHGNEVIGREILLQLIKHLCENYGKDDEVTRLVDKTRLHILPAANPDGYELAAARKKSESPDVTEDVIGRLNANGVDLNRNFPDQFFELNTETFEPETAAIMQWVKQHPFALSASFHSGALVVTYPFDDSPSGLSAYSATPDDDLFRSIAKSYSENHPQMHLANPKMNCTRPLKRFTDGISNGAAWSSLNGGMQDYNYVRSNCYEVTVELGCHKFPKEEKLESFWQENKKPLIKFAEMASKGIKGYIRDDKGNPIKGARISVGDRKHDIRSADDGDYWRLLVPGTYDIQCRAKGFRPHAQNVEVGTGDATVLNFTMVPKMEDELEATLGHVNRATLITHDIMYRYDGRDSGNAAPKEVIEKMEEPNSGREGSKDVPETMSNEEGLGSGSGSDEVAQAQKLAESLATNMSPISRATRNSGAAKRTYEREFVPDGSTVVMKRAKISRPDNKNKKNKTKKSSKKSKTAATTAAAKDTNSAATNLSKTANATTAAANQTSGFEDEAVQKLVEEKFHVKPTIGMHIKCKIPGKQDLMKGTLKFVGHISNLPKKNNVVVAGLELDHKEELGTDGTFLGKRYFVSHAKRGYFVPVKNCTPI